MSSRDKILQSVRSKDVPSADLPDLNQAWIEFEDASDAFRQSLEMVGGTPIFVRSMEEAASTLAEHLPFRDAKKSVSLFPEIVGNVDFAQIDDPHQLEDIDFAVLPGEFCVAENAAVWVTDEKIKHRVILFIPQHLALIVDGRNQDGSAVVHNMHQAYQRISPSDQTFGCFVSGPSKTADIEQSLVIGAHGARSLIVVVII